MLETGELLRPTPLVMPLIKDYARKRNWSEHTVDDISSWCTENDFLKVERDKTVRITAKGMDFISSPLGLIQVILDKYAFLAGGLFTGAIVFIWHIIK